MSEPTKLSEAELAKIRSSDKRQRIYAAGLCGVDPTTQGPSETGKLLNHIDAQSAELAAKDEEIRRLAVLADMSEPWIDRLTTEQKQQFCAAFEDAVLALGWAEIESGRGGEIYTPHLVKGIRKACQVAEESKAIAFAEWT